MVTINNNNNRAFLAATAVAAAAGLVLLRRRRQKQESKAKSGDDDDQEQRDDRSAIYLDYNGTTPIYSSVVDAMMPYLTTHYGNPSSSHWAGDEPRQAVNRARQQVLCDLLQAKNDIPLEACIFTACGTESDNLAIHLALQQKRTGNNKNNNNKILLPHVVTCNVEHPAMEACLRMHEKAGRCTVTFVPVQPDGRVRASDMIAAIRADTVLVTLMLANNESGALQPVKEVAEYCRRKQDILFATDAAQAVGKVKVTLQTLGDPDMVSIVGHKIGAPKGIACLYVRPGCLDTSTENNTDDDNDTATDSISGLLIGGGQEFGLRAGTENVPYIVGFGVAASNAAKKVDNNRQHMETLRHRLQTRLEDALGKDNVRVHGPADPAHRLPNTLSIGFAGGIHSGALLAAVRDKVAASAGATCHAATGPVSAILQAMQIPDNWARATVRLSLGPKTTAEEIDCAAAILAQEVKRQRCLVDPEHLERTAVVAGPVSRNIDTERFGSNL